MGRKERIDKKNIAKLEFTQLGHWWVMDVEKRKKEKNPFTHWGLTVENYKMCGLGRRKEFGIGSICFLMRVSLLMEITATLGSRGEIRAIQGHRGESRNGGDLGKMTT